MDDHDGWDPERYRRFAEERAQPFHDLLAMVEPGGLQRAVDLGCGDGRLTSLAAERLGLGEVVGIDASPAMLADAEQRRRPGLRFERGDLGTWTSSADHDLVLANASLQWAPDHPAVLARWAAALAPGGQLAVQVPANPRGPAQVVAVELAHLEPYRSAFGPGGPPPDPVEANVLEPEVYSRLLHRLGFEHQRVRLEVYAHVLPGAAAAVEWARGTTLTRFRGALPEALHAAFVEDYERRLRAALGPEEPLLFPFPRLLLWGRRPR